MADHVKNNNVPTIKVSDILQPAMEWKESKIIFSNYLDKEVKRTWKERLFTRPWNPFKKTNLILDNHCYVFGGMMVMSSRFKYLEGVLKNANNAE